MENVARRVASSGGLEQLLHGRVIEKETQAQTHAEGHGDGQDGGEAERLKEPQGDECTHHDKGPVADVDHLEHPENQAETHGGHTVNRPENEALNQIAGEQFKDHVNPSS